MSNYDENYFRTANYAGYLERERRYHQTAAELADLLEKVGLLRKDSHVVDYGCAVGFLLSGFYRRGYKRVCGVDVSEFARGETLKRGFSAFGNSAEAMRVMQGRADVVIALDVFEHMLDGEIEVALHNLRPDAIVVRIPVAGDEGGNFHLAVSRADKTHINCKTAGGWRDFFAERGYPTGLPLNLYTVYDSPGVHCALYLRPQR